ncbi:MAG TPA: hypothetical protein VMB74_07115, partial [Streptosporangiaceae bacterium]|nr:hypothetical protein [Streptosporangiaceae bacterium]
MTDPGWDIPGVARDADAPAAGTADDATAGSSAAASSNAGSPVRGRRPGRKGRSGSVSASSGLSAGAFGRLAEAGSYVAWSVSSPGSVAPCTARSGAA